MVTKATGVGISLRHKHYDDVLANKRRLDWIEVNPENFMENGVRPHRVIAGCAENYPVFTHGVSMSIGGPDPLEEDYLVALKKLVDFLDPEYFTDHACYSRAGGFTLHDLLPMPFTEEAALHMAARAREVQDRLNRPFLLENISYYAIMPTSQMTEGQFMTAMLEAYDGGMLLDVNNVYVNARNHGRPPLEVLHELPLHRTRHIHLAGHYDRGDVILDDHGSHVIDPVWDLYREAIRVVGPTPTIIEWEHNTPSWDRLLDEADTARRIQDEALAERGRKKPADARVSELQKVAP